MRISKIIKVLAEQLEEHGDIEVVCETPFGLNNYNIEFISQIYGWPDDETLGHKVIIRIE